jgi:uncharacterized protein (TIGR02453 family)
LEPLQGLVVDLAPFMLDIDPLFELRPAVGKTISRIFRDTRFSHDKAPFRSTMWITFKRPVKHWVESPAYFFELSSDSYRFGMGFYSAGPSTMDRLRGSIEKDPLEFLEAIAFYPKQGTFSLEGDTYKRPIPNQLAPEIQPWYQKKSFYLVSNRLADDLLLRRELVDELMDGYRVLAPIYRYPVASGTTR